MTFPSGPTRNAAGIPCTPHCSGTGVFDRHTRNDVFRDAKLASAQRWGMAPTGQHVELGIAEQNLFLMLAAAGLQHSLTGARLLPVGTVYDPFVNRGLDALIYACYQDARFLLVSTPSGLTLAFSPSWLQLSQDRECQEQWCGLSSRS